MVPECASQIVACGRAGVTEIILVVGNDDDAAEVTLVALETIPHQETGRFKQALLAAERLRTAVRALWNQGDHDAGSQAPQIKLMTDQRKPLQTFAPFPRLPLEIQAEIWR